MVKLKARASERRDNLPRLKRREPAVHAASRETFSFELLPKVVDRMTA
jgi:hypothetical protein